jgi:hypothetical protein
MKQELTRCPTCGKNKPRWAYSENSMRDKRATRNCIQCCCELGKTRQQEDRKSPDPAFVAQRAARINRRNDLILAKTQSSLHSLSRDKHEHTVITVDHGHIADLVRRIESTNGHAYTPQMEAALLPERRPGE